MSVQAMSWVLDNSESRLADRLVLLAIANHCDRYGTDSWPLHTTIAAEARVSVREVVRAIQALTALGELTVEKGAGEIGRNRYTLVKFAEMQSAKLSCESEVLSDNSTLFQVTNATRNKEEPSLTVLKNTSPTSKKKSLTRNQEVYEFIKAGYERKRLTLTWGPAEWKQLAGLLKERPDMADLNILRTCLNNRFKSEKVNPGERPCQWLRKLPNYQLGPLNEFGKMLKSEVQMVGDTTFYA